MLTDHPPWSRISLPRRHATCNRCEERSEGESDALPEGSSDKRKEGGMKFLNASEEQSDKKLEGPTAGPPVFKFCLFSRLTIFTFQ